MIHKIKNQNIPHNAFTLIEMLIVLIVMWIMLMVTLLLSWNQIQKVRDKTVKETILAEMQSRYSRNLWSSSFAWIMYDHLDVEFSNESNEITFSYYTLIEYVKITKKWGGILEINIKEKRILYYIRSTNKYMTSDYKFDWGELYSVNNIKLRYNPYKISCKIWDETEEYNNLVIVTRVNNSTDYCFEIKQKNCRLVEVSEEKCTTLKTLVEMPD